MKFFAALFLNLALFASCAFANQDRIEHPQHISIGFRPGETVLFTVTSDKIVAIEIDLKSTRLKVPSEIVAKIHQVHFDSVALLWNGSFEKATDSDFVSIQFSVGARPDRLTGESPSVQLVFHNRNFLGGFVRPSQKSEERKRL